MKSQVLCKKQAYSIKEDKGNIAQRIQNVQDKFGVNK